MTDRIVLRGRVITPFLEIPLGAVMVEQGRIAWIRPGEESVSGAQELGGEGYIVAPGFIDLQVNGLAGRDISEGRDAIEEISKQLPRFGVTAFLPTLVSRPLSEMLEFVAAVSDASPRGARILGAHLEGPFLNPDFRGVHDPDALLEPRPADVQELLNASPKMVTLAPELRGGLEAVQRFSSAGVIVSAGHCGATYEEAKAAIEAGLTFGTHLFNGMRPFGHREPGIVGALLSDARVTVGLIPDEVHVHPAAVDLVLGMCGPARLALTTDQTAGAGAPPGRYRLAGMELISDAGGVRTTDGKIAGSIATMDGLVRGLARRGAELVSLMKMTSATPARVLGEEERLGMIAPGQLADLVLLDQDLQVRATLVEGRVVYSRGA